MTAACFEGLPGPALAIIPGSLRRGFGQGDTMGYRFGKLPHASEDMTGEHAANGFKLPAQTYIRMRKLNTRIRKRPARPRSIAPGFQPRPWELSTTNTPWKGYANPELIPSERSVVCEYISGNDFVHFGGPWPRRAFEDPNYVSIRSCRTLAPFPA